MWDLNSDELKIYKRLNTPAKVQDYLNALMANFENDGETGMSPRRVIQTRMAHCVEAAVFAATVFWFHKQEPLLMDLRSAKHDYDHVVALFKVRDRWGAVSKSNHAVLRYREPVYANPRELAMSYFHEYYDDDGLKTMRDYSVPFNLKRYKDWSWITSEDDNWFIPNDLDKIKHTKILHSGQAKSLRKADKIELDATELVEWKNKK